MMAVSQDGTSMAHAQCTGLIWLACLAVLAMALVLGGCGSKEPAPREPVQGTGSTRPYTVRGTTYYPLSSARGYDKTGTASWYGPSFHGRLTSSGERYNQNDLTAAHTVLPFQTRVEVTNLSNGKSVVVRVNDRGPFSKSRIIDLSKAAASRIDMLGPGTAKVRVRALDGAPRQARPAPGVRQSGTFFIQVGAFKNPANVRKADTAARRAGYSVSFRETSGGLRRVLLGPWKTLDSANSALWKARDIWSEAYLVSDD